MRPTPTVSPHKSLLAAAVLPAILLAGCSDRIVAPDASPSVSARATRNTADAAGQGCAAIAAAHPGAADGDYAMLGLGGATFKVYCNDMSTSPATFLTLAISGPESGKNFGSWAGEYQHLWEDHVIETYYSRLRFDPATLLVDNNDLTFSQTIGGRAFGPGAYLYNFPYANAADCLGWPPSGRANIDLNGTPFSIDDNFLTDGWFPYGYVNGQDNGWGQVKSVTGKTVDLVGGGFCGGTAPSKVSGFTQFAFTGPGLSSPTVTLSASSPVIRGSAATISASASHPDNVPVWTSWNLGDGSTGSGAIPSTHTYANSGTYPVQFTATDGATTPASATQSVKVLSCTEATGYVGQIITGMLSENDARPLVVSLDGVAASLDKGNMSSANGKLGAFDNKLQAALNSGKIGASTYATLAGYSAAIRVCMGL
jgi:hypothetical protein